MNRNKIKLLICLGVIFTIVVGLVFSGNLVKHADMQNDTDMTEYDGIDTRYIEYLKSFEKDVKDSMTTNEKLQNLQEAEEVLERLQKRIDSEETNPEERFDARRTYRVISKRRDILRKYLNQEKNNLRKQNTP